MVRKVEVKLVEVAATGGSRGGERSWGVESVREVEVK